MCCLTCDRYFCHRCLIQRKDQAVACQDCDVGSKDVSREFLPKRLRLASEKDSQQTETEPNSNKDRIAATAATGRKFPIANGKISCETCKSQFANAGNLKRHMLSIHSKKK